MMEIDTQVTADQTSVVNNAAAFLRRTVRSVVADPDAVEVGTSVAGNKTHFRLHVSPDDQATLMASSQRTFISLQCIVAALGRKSGMQFALDCQGIDGLPS